MSNRRKLRRAPSPIAVRERPNPEPKPTGMVAYGARCMWWDEKANVATRPGGLPCCPHCDGVLFETEIQRWWSGAQAVVDRGDVQADYLDFLRWLRGRCYATRDEALAAWRGSS